MKLYNFTIGGLIGLIQPTQVPDQAEQIPALQFLVLGTQTKFLFHLHDQVSVQHKKIIG